MGRKEVDAAGECVACKTQKQGIRAKTAHAIFCPKQSKHSKPRAHERGVCERYIGERIYEARFGAKKGRKRARDGG